ncbi:MAG: hypothetical protein ACTSWC_03275 [Promethearchaeota archaeon]
MPKVNPKHRKLRAETINMGVKKSTGTCGIEKCSQPVKQHVAKANIDKYATQLKWSIKESSKKPRKIGLCKEHYKQFHKLQKKDEKYTRPRMFDSEKKPSRYKSNVFLE